MSSRTYGDACGIAHALDLVGERWALLVVRELILGPKRFSDLRESLPGAGPTILSQRLRELERIGVIQREKLPPPAAAQVYELTTWGAELGPMLVALGGWAARSPIVTAEGRLGADSVLLRLSGSFTESDNSWSASYEFHFDTQRFTVEVTNGTLTTITRGPATHPDVVITTSPATLYTILEGDLTLPTAISEGLLQVTATTHDSPHNPHETLALLLAATTNQPSQHQANP